MIHRRNRVLPYQYLFRDEWPEVALDRSHVAMRKLEPGARERVRELLRMLVETPRDPLVGWVEPQREVCRQHGRNAFFRLVVRIGNVGAGIFRFPLIGAGRTRLEFPFIFEQIVEKVIAPLRRCLRPGDFRAARDGVRAEAHAVLALPAKALIFDRSAFRLWADQGRITRAVRLAEAVAACNQRDGFFVVHCHPSEGLANVARRRDRVGLAVRSLRIDVDKAHLHCPERVLKLAFAAIAFVAEPCAFGAPIKFVGLPCISAAACEAERLEAHRLQRDVPHEHQEIRP